MPARVPAWELAPSAREFCCAWLLSAAVRAEFQAFVEMFASDDAIARAASPRATLSAAPARAEFRLPPAAAWAFKLGSVLVDSVFVMSSRAAFCAAAT